VFDRYAIYYTPQGALAELGATWLGWDVAQAVTRTHPDVAGVDVAALTETPRQYGFHGTIKPPFALASDSTEAELRAATRDLCAHLAPVTLEALEVSAMGSFLALTPCGDQKALRSLAAEVVRGLDAFRAPPSEAELARRRERRLSAAQEANLTDWGYPYVMDQFRFHITLTGRVARAEVESTRVTADALFIPLLPKPYKIDSLTLVGQRSDGNFQEIERFDLTG